MSITSCAEGPLSKLDSRSLRFSSGSAASRRQLVPRYSGAMPGFLVKTRCFRSMGRKRLVRLWSASALPRKRKPPGPSAKEKFESTVCCACAPKYMRVLRETSRSTFEIGGSLKRSLRPKTTRAANVAAHGRPAVAVFEVLGPEILRDRLGRLRVVSREPGRGKRVVVEVGGIDLDPLRVGLGPECLGEEHGDRVRLFSRRAAGRPARIFSPSGFCSTIFGTISLATYSQAAGSRKNPVTLIRIVSRSSANSRGSASR